MKRRIALLFLLALLLQSTACASGLNGGRKADGSQSVLSEQTVSQNTESALPESRETGASDVFGSAFSDVPAGSWYGEAVTYLREQGLMYGTTDTTFSPNSSMTRAMLAAVLYRAAGSPAVTGSSGFTDLRPGAYYVNGISWAAQRQIVAGFGNGRFGPEERVTREQTAAILWRYAGSPKPENARAFADAASISAWAAEAVGWAREQGIVSGRGQNHFVPKAPITRGELRVMLYRYLKPETPSPSPGEKEEPEAPGPSADKAGGFDLETGTVLLNSGYSMPVNGLGTYSLHGDTCVNSIKAALKSGVRLIDTASAYGNEAEVGRAIREAMAEQGIEREEIFVTTKIYPGTEMADPERFIQACLDRLDIGYVDLMLLHHPDPNDVKAYRAMEKLAAEGKIRSIGLSNWYVEELESFLPQVTVTPALVQNEIHPYYQENDVIPYIQEKGIVVQGWYPLGGRGHTAELLGDPVISEIARAHGKSPAQVILRWNLQKGVAVIPGSSDPDHIQENTELYDFELTEEEMRRINALDRNEKHDWY